MAEPVELPKHNTLVTDVLLLKAVGWVMVIVLLEVQALASVTVTVLTPAFKPVTTDPVAELDHK